MTAARPALAVPLPVVLDDPSRVADVPGDEIIPLLDSLAAQEGRCHLVRDLLTARLEAGACDRGSRSSGPSPKEDDDRLFDVKEAASFLGLPVSYLGELGRRGKLSRIAHGKYVRFRVGDLRQWIQAHRESTIVPGRYVTYPDVRDGPRDSPRSTPARSDPGAAGGPGGRGQKQRRTLGARRIGNPVVRGASDSNACDSEQEQVVERPEVT